MSTQRTCREASKTPENSWEFVKECGKNSEGQVRQRVGGGSKAVGCSWQDGRQDKAVGKMAWPKIRAKTTRQPQDREQSTEDNEKKANSCLSFGDESKSKTQTREWGKLGYFFRVTKTGLYTKASPL